MRLTFASYNIHKGIGLDRRRDPHRILRVLEELDADVVALQEADRRFGRRAAVIPRTMLADAGWQAAPVNEMPEAIGWHGNALLVREGIRIVEAEAVHLPVLEPRGAIRADLQVEGVMLRVGGMHLDLSGLRRRQQMRAVLSHVHECEGDPPAVLMGDMNEWRPRGSCFREPGTGWRVLAPGKSYPSRKPVAQLDRLVMSGHWKNTGCGVHSSELARVASDHLPVYARLALA